MWRADIGDGRAVAQSVLVEILHFRGRIDVEPATPVQSAKVGYQVIA